MNKKKISTFLIVSFFYIICLIFMVNNMSDILDFRVIFNYKFQILKAFFTTIKFSFISLVLSLILGFIIFIMQKSSNLYLNYFVSIYKEIIMGTPLLVMIFLIVYVIGVSLDIHNKEFLGIIAITMYMSPYMSNIFEGAYNTIDKNQFVIMDFYDFNLYQKYRYIILPQMVRPIIPGLINNLSGIVKGTSILSTIAIEEIFYTVSVLSNNTYKYIEGYFILWLVYLIITIPLSLLAKYYSRKWNI
ncbi:MAG: amino acid ABC transporter permease [Peptostreptococcaceae bacterium]|nr:amino acid ABC transporter permease [Peptostreptococcaceae bacterium]